MNTEAGIIGFAIMSLIMGCLGMMFVLDCGEDTIGWKLGKAVSWMLLGFPLVVFIIYALKSIVYVAAWM